MYRINGVSKVNDKEIDSEVFEKVGYCIAERDNQIDNLIDWIGEAKGNDRELFLGDLKFLMSIEDEYILSSLSTNGYEQECTVAGQNILKEIYES